ncbi:MULTISPECIES: methionyl-tRNA formyltransferase [Terrabacteria group]|uniref:methionyl-tRNA formyltransferase n=1 Tax=Bacillati TaxID=1783272 RepID=UPI00193A0895|nr:MULTISPECIES: methionyl-tRNA formyltransferase [Terrabacteria group]MBW9211901.1 methionyl-tRNA formyltransferase [Trueperella sp. zg.1013]QRG87298.1 methionyl-tRNA formyltransferase [Bulleidia sp. zg-1006]
MNILFFGTPEFAKEMLETLYQEKYNIVAIVSQPDHFLGRKKVLTPTPTHQFALEHNIPCLQPEKLKEAVEEVLSYQPDFILTCAYGQFIPQAILDYPKYSCLNIHPSQLPKYRGGAPIHHAIMNGEKETAVSLMKMVKKMDAGDIYAQRVIEVGEDERFYELNQRLISIAKVIIREDLPLYFEGKLKAIVQEEDKVSLGLNLTKEEEMVHFQTEAIHQLYNHIRALYDWPIAYGLIDGKRIKFITCRKEVCEHTKTIGEVVGLEGKGLKIACQGGYLVVYELQPEGKKTMDAKSFMNGFGRSLIGHCFE